MDFFLSSESDGRYDDLGEALRLASNEVSHLLEPFLKDRDYGSDLVDVAVIPIIIKFDPQMEQEGWFQERVLYKRKTKEADVRLRIEYDLFIAADHEGKKLLILDNILRSMDALAHKAKGFRPEQFRADLLGLFGLTDEKLQEGLEDLKKGKR